MLERFLKLKESLTILLAKKEWSRKASLAKAKFCQEDFTLMERVVKVLQAFNEVTEHLSHNSACISEVIPVVTILLAALDRGNDVLGVVGYKFNLRSKLRKKSDILRVLTFTLWPPLWTQGTAELTSLTRQRPRIQQRSLSL